MLAQLTTRGPSYAVHAIQAPLHGLELQRLDSACTRSSCKLAASRSAHRVYQSSTEANTHTKLAKATSSVTCQESISKDAILPLYKLRGTCRSDLAFVLHHMTVEELSKSSKELNASTLQR